MNTEELEIDAMMHETEVNCKTDLHKSDASQTTVGEGGEDMKQLGDSAVL